MAAFNPHEYKCQFCRARQSIGCGRCPTEETRRTVHKFVGIRKIKSEVKMPYKDPRFRHIRRRPPRTIVPDSYYTVPVTHTKATGSYPKGTLARIGTSKKTGNTVIQAILIPLKKGAH